MYVPSEAGSSAQGDWRLFSEMTRQGVATLRVAAYNAMRHGGSRRDEKPSKYATGRPFPDSGPQRLLFE